MERARSTRPCAKAIERHWGWCELLADAIGVQPNLVHASSEALLDERALMMLAALRAACNELGRWPMAIEWDQAGRKPSSRTFVRHFGGWREARLAADVINDA